MSCPTVGRPPPLSAATPRRCCRTTSVPPRGRQRRPQDTHISEAVGGRETRVFPLWGKLSGLHRRPRPTVTKETRPSRLLLLGGTQGRGRDDLLVLRAVGPLGSRGPVGVGASAGVTAGLARLLRLAGLSGKRQGFQTVPGPSAALSVGAEWCRAGLSWCAPPSPAGCSRPPLLPRPGAFRTRTPSCGDHPRRFRGLLLVALAFSVLSRVWVCLGAFQLSSRTSLPPTFFFFNFYSLVLGLSVDCFGIWRCFDWGPFENESYLYIGITL